MLKCREISRLIATDALREAGFTKRLGIRLHLLMCTHCDRFASQLRRIRRTYRQLFENEGGKDGILEDRIASRILLSRKKPRDE